METVVAVEEQELLNKYETNPDKKVEALNKLMAEQKDELKKFDSSLVVQLDQKVDKCEFCCSVYWFLYCRLLTNNKHWNWLVFLVFMQLQTR